MTMIPAPPNAAVTKVDRRLILAVGLLLLTLGLIPSALAERRTTLEQAVNEARERYPGRVLSAETERRGGRESHQIRILTDDGRVKRLRIDAESGSRERPQRR